MDSKSSSGTNGCRSLMGFRQVRSFGSFSSICTSFFLQIGCFWRRYRFPWQPSRKSAFQSSERSSSQFSSSSEPRSRKFRRSGDTTPHQNGRHSATFFWTTCCYRSRKATFSKRFSGTSSGSKRRTFFWKSRQSTSSSIGSKMCRILGF